MDATDARRPGYRWVKLPNKHWYVAYEAWNGERSFYRLVDSDHTFIERDLRALGERISSPDERPIEHSPAAPAGEVEAAVKWALFEADRYERHAKTLPNNLGNVRSDAEHEADMLRTLAAAATRAAQERRLAVEMREAAASLLQSESNSWRERATYLRAAVTRMGTGAPRCDERAYTLGECADGLDSKIAAIRALPIPGEEQKA